MSSYSKPKNNPPKALHNSKPLSQRWAEGKTDDFTVSKRRGRPKTK